MAESVDATVSNTVGAIHPGSIPGPGTSNPLQLAELEGIYFSSTALIGFKRTRYIGI